MLGFGKFKPCHHPPTHTHTPEFRHVLMIMELLTRDININRTIVGV